MITKYGYDVFFIVVLICLAAIILSLAFIEPKVPRYVVSGAALVFLILTVNFFRDPDRSTPQGENLVIAPADGKILGITEVEENEYLGSKAKRISIFMSPMNVHVNRNPVTGAVGHLRYVKGEYFAAFEEKASEKNEQMIVGIQHPKGRVLFKQIAGFLARRIVCTLNMGDQVKAGERFGMIKFGSRVDVFVPAQTVVRAKAGDLTVAGETVLAELQ
jgi:phosphatidylserine decarboxylase